MMNDEPEDEREVKQKKRLSKYMIRMYRLPPLFIYSGLSKIND